MTVGLIGANYLQITSTKEININIHIPLNQTNNLQALEFRIRDLVIEMRQGVFDEFIIKDQTVDSFMEIYEKVLKDNEFAFKDKKRDKNVLRHIAIWGEGKKAFKRSLVPGGALTKKGNRYAAEAEISQKDKDPRMLCLSP